MRSEDEWLTLVIQHNALQSFIADALDIKNRMQRCDVFNGGDDAQNFLEELFLSVPLFQGNVIPF